MTSVPAAAPVALDCKIASNRLGTYCVPASSADRPAARAVLRGKVYERETLAFMAANCGDKDIVHAGTFFGDFLPALSTALAPHARVWAFEPNSESFRCAEITLLLNRINNVDMRNAGLGAASAPSYVLTANFLGRVLGGTSRIVSQVRDGAVAEPVEIVAIDDVVPPHREVGILQLDIEGYEQHALTGAFGTMRRCRPILILEQQPRHSFLDGEWFEDNILSMGYELAQTMHLNRVYRPITR
jgi:FkbM family methyltransferase